MPPGSRGSSTRSRPRPRCSRTAPARASRPPAPPIPRARSATAIRRRRRWRSGSARPRSPFVRSFRNAVARGEGGDRDRGRPRHRPRPRARPRARRGTGGRERPRRLARRRRPGREPRPGGRERDRGRGRPGGGELRRRVRLRRCGGDGRPGGQPLRRPRHPRQQRRDPARPDAREHDRGGVGRRHRGAPEGPLRTASPRRRLLARALEGRRGGARPRHQHVEPVGSVRERGAGQLRRGQGRDRRADADRRAGARPLRRHRQLPRTQRAHAHDRGHLRRAGRARGGLRPARPGQHGAGRGRALRRRGAGHHRPVLLRLGRRGERAAAVGGRRALRRRGALGRGRAALRHSRERFPEGAAPAGMLAAMEQAGGRSMRVDA